MVYIVRGLTLRNFFERCKIAGLQKSKLKASSGKSPLKSFDSIHRGTKNTGTFESMKKGMNEL